MEKLIRSPHAVRPGVSAKLVTVTAGGGLVPPVFAAVTNLSMRVVSCPSWEASLTLDGGFPT